MNILLFSGAGTSVELGVPGMRGMAEEFIEHSKQWDVEPDLVTRLMSTTLDIEHLIEELDRICTARSSLELLGESTERLARVDKIRAEVEWFVQHAAERVVASDARLMWGSVLRTARTHQLTLVTTNYDRAIELAANGEDIALDDGFETFDAAETAEWRSFGGRKDAQPLVKLHGSTDWYSDSVSRRPTKLRHPMPLFGRAELRLSTGVQLGSALVLPSREKLLTRDPYPRLSQAFLNACDRCDVAIFVGTSLRDQHVRSAVGATASRVPVFVVGPRGSDCGIKGIVPIKQQASGFLISTLPNAMLTPDLVAALKDASESSVPGCVLGAVKLSLSTAASPENRRHALEELDDIGAALAPDLLMQLLSDADPTVARYALGLIPRSAIRADLVGAAANTAHVADPAFAQDLSLLQGMLGS